MFGGGSNPTASRESKDADAKPSPSPPDAAGSSSSKASDQVSSGDKRSGNGSPPGRQDTGSSADKKKRRASGVQSRASSLIASAKNTLNFGQVGRTNSDSSQSPLQKLGKQDPALAVPQGQHNNSAGESLPGPRSTFRVGVWEDRNKKCRRTMEDTHAFLYNFLHTPAPAVEGNKSETRADCDDKDPSTTTTGATSSPPASDLNMVETDNGYFAIFDGHAGTFAADWCGKKLHLILEDLIRRNPNMPIPELLDQTFTTVDAQLEKLPLKNSGCTAAIAVLRWEDRVASDKSATGSQAIAPAVAAAAKTQAATGEGAAGGELGAAAGSEAAHTKLKSSAFRQRVLYTANVGDARIILCRSGKALRLSYDHKGSDENEGRRIANAGGLILNNRVNGVLAVTRALGDAYIKGLVTGHPYTTETVIHPETDEFIIIACDGLWDVCSDQEAVDLVRDVEDATDAAKLLVDHALNRFSTDNLSCMTVRFDKAALLETQKDKENALGVEKPAQSGQVSEADKIVREAQLNLAQSESPAAGSDPGDDTQPAKADGMLEEEPNSVGGNTTTECPEVSMNADVAPSKEAETANEPPKEAATKTNSS
ncbi:PP2C-domain-containing protein [Sodiomyces alkalinus F11]|uniref:PP2C-domain-containing protein n=1 Tax=Sodiomyces alkalinus (strain CBS 110278 / VKM F-3762 / F11) TaxID=1314773 RepID=A0A3N2Q5Y8_SODAK|nr:PP2C-domain-containing protein [Sodiomyces alkalinus F11]ROT42116.1 PP2C-domain-containing protein [Sodiomyces alkalinus F11]